MWIFKLYAFFKLIVALILISGSAIIIAWIIGMVKRFIGKQD